MGARSLGLVAAARDPERFSAELEAARLLRTEDAFELLRAEPAFELLRAAVFELLRAELELAAVAPLSLAAGRLRLAAFGDALCFVLVCLATSRPLYGRCHEDHVLQPRLRRGRMLVPVAALRSARETP